MYRADSHITIAKEIPKCMLHFGGVWLIWDDSDTDPAEKHSFYSGKGNESQE
jgi:hypothetical protein